MIVGVMQPYLFPYIGYYQLVNHCDIFVFYDDVNFIKKGYINRNNILVGNRSHRFTLPVLKNSQNVSINKLYFSESIKKILTTIEHSYRRAPFFSLVFPIIKRVLNSSNRNVAYVASQSIEEVFKYLGINKNYRYSSVLNYDRSLPACEKLIQITKGIGGDIYCNSIGGRELYNYQQFNEVDLSLQFVIPELEKYNQGNHQFISGLSMIDVLMWNSKKKVKELLKKYEVIDE